MKPKTIGVLAGITILGIVVAILVNQDPATQVPRSGELLFPQLLSKVNEVNEIVVTTHDQTVTLVRGEEMWKVKEKEGYPADMEKVKQTLLGLAELQILEPKTSNPELYDRLGLQDPGQEGSLATAVTVKTPNDPEAAVVIVGNQRPAKGNPRMSDIYVRQPGEPQTWLVTGNLPLDKVPEEWLEKEITALPAKRVHRVTVTHSRGETLQVSKIKPEDVDFHLNSVPAGFKVASQFNVNNVAGTLVQLSLENVQKAEEVKFQPNAGVTAVVETFDGLRLHVQTMEQGERVYGKFSAEFDPALIQPVESGSSSPSAETGAASPSAPGTMKTSGDKPPAEPPIPSSKEASNEDSVLKDPEEVQKEVMVLNQRVEGWVYELPKFRVENFTKPKQELLAKSE
jgi:hypothetical protein